jgi:putative acetyltransferase
MPFSIRRLEMVHMRRAARVLRASFDDRLPWLAGLHTPEEDRDFFLGPVFSSCEVWGAVDGDIVGVIAFRRCWVDQLYVLPAYQRRGAGDALLQVAMKANASLSLRTFQRNLQARHFYEARGFVAVDETDGTSNEEREPDVLYRWDGAGSERP